jgi:hypothetical protein
MAAIYTYIKILYVAKLIVCNQTAGRARCNTVLFSAVTRTGRQGTSYRDLQFIKGWQTPRRLLIVEKLVTKFTVFYGRIKFINVFTRAKDLDFIQNGTMKKNFKLNPILQFRNSNCAKDKMRFSPLWSSRNVTIVYRCTKCGSHLHSMFL